MTKINRSLNLLYPPMREKLEDALFDCQKKGLPVYVFEGYRSPERQAELFSKGRTTPGKIVTHAQAGFSYHQYGLAVDIVFDASEKPGIQWTWEPNGEGYYALRKIMIDHGFEFLSFEMAHFQMTYGQSISKLREKFLFGGFAHVWEYLDGLSS